MCVGMISVPNFKCVKYSVSVMLRNFFRQDAMITYSVMENIFGLVVKILSVQ